MINSAKVEVEALKTIGRGKMQPTGFIAIEHKDTLDAGTTRRRRRVRTSEAEAACLPGNRNGSSRKPVKAGIQSSRRSGSGP